MEKQDTNKIDFLNSETPAIPPQERPKGNPKSLQEILSKTNIEDTEIFDGDEMFPTDSTDYGNDADYENKLLNNSSQEQDEDEDEFIKTSPSIMDLLQKKTPSTGSLTETDRDIQTENDGKSLDEILKEDGLHKDKNDSTKTEKKKYTRPIIIIVAALIIITAGAVYINVCIKVPKPSEMDSKALPMPNTKVKISPNLKDKNKLKFYLKMGENLYKKKRYKDALQLFTQLLKTNWNNGLIYGMLGNCKLQLKDEATAKHYYQRSLKEGYFEDAKFALNLAKILKKEKKYTEIISVLSPFEKKHGSNQEISMTLAEAYSKTGDLSKTIACYKKLNPGNMSESQIRDYAMHLEKDGDKNSAFKIYLMLGKLYGRTSAYIKAEQLAPDKKTRISILAKLVSKTAMTPEGNYYKLILAIGLIDAGNKNEGIALLKSIRTGELSKKAATQYLAMAPYFVEEPLLVREIITILNKYYASDLHMHNKIMQNIKDSGKEAFCKEFFKMEYSLYPKNPIANYIYALTLNNPTHKKAILLKAIKLSPKSLYMKLTLAKVYIAEQRWKKAYTLLQECIKKTPYNSEAQYYIAVAKINLSVASRALKDYENFLKSTQLSKTEILKKMVLMSEHMLYEKYPLKYLEQAEKEPQLKEFCEVEKIKIKLIYGTAKKEDFKNTDNPLIQKYYIIFLLGSGGARTVINMTKKDAADIEFWKLLIRWKQSLPSWKQKAYKLFNLKKDDLLISTILKLWLKKISIKEAEAMLNSIPTIDKPLLANIIAEQYNKNKNTSKATFFFRKAAKYSNPNIYKALSKYMRQ